MFNMGNLGDILRNAGKLREAVEQANESLGALELEGTSAGGAVTAKVNGRLELVALRIDPKLLEDQDTELLEDLIVAAVNQGIVRAREAAAESLRSLAGGMSLPGLGDAFGPLGR